MLRFIVFGYVLIASMQAAAITSGHLTLSGVDNIGSRGYGRSIFVDMISTPSNFELGGADGDTTSAPPGSISGGSAFAATQADVARVNSNSANLGFTQPIGSAGIAVWSTGLLFFTSGAMALPVLPAPPTGAYTTFTLSPVPFTMTGHLLLTDRFNGNAVVLDEIVSGSGMVTMKGGYASFGAAPAYYIWESRFDFSVPEPASAGLLGAGLIALVMLRRRFGRPS